MDIVKEKDIIEEGIITRDAEQKIAKKPTLVEQGWSIPAGTVLPMDYEIGHYPFFVYGDLTAGRKIIKFKGGHWCLDSTEYPTFDDLDVLVGIMKLVEDLEFSGKTMAGEIAKTVRNGEDLEMEVLPVVTSKRQLLKYCGKTVGVKQEQGVMRAIHRLSIFSATRFSENGHETRQVKFIYKYGSEQVGKYNKLKLLIPLDFLHHCRTLNRMLIHWKEIQELNTQLEKAVFLYLEMNKHVCVTENRLMKFLGVVPPVKLAEKASKKEVAIYKATLTAFNNRKHKVYYDLVHKAFPRMVEMGRLKGFNEATNIRFIKKGKSKGKRYFILIKNEYYGMTYTPPVQG